MPDDVGKVAREVLDDVRTRGDDAVRDATARWDDVEIDELEIPRSRVDAAADRFASEEPGAAAALARLVERVRTVQSAVEPERRVDVAPDDGVEVTIRRVALDRVGAYVPGGRAAYPSTVPMVVVPALVAGVEEIVLCSPPGPGGDPPDAVLAAVELVDEGDRVRVFRIGGAQAVAAMAHGTESVPTVAKIVGPGNAYVDAAKAALPDRVGRDMPAGPTELVVVADGTADPDDVARDLLAQAEHDPDAWSVLATDDAGLADDVAARVEDPVGTVRIAVAPTLDAAIDWTRDAAPEHARIVADGAATLGADLPAGTVFAGSSTPSVLGDYATGASHVLPTGGAARWRGPLGVDDFVVPRVVQTVAEGAEAVRSDAAALAAVEGLDAHRRAAEGRS